MGALSEDRGKLLLFSFNSEWIELTLWARMDSNHRPSGYEPRALPLSYGPPQGENYIIKRIDEEREVLYNIALNRT